MPDPSPHAAEPPRQAAASDPVLTVDEVAQLLRVNRKTIYEAFGRGEIPGGRRIGRTIRFARAAILAWLEQGESAPPPRRRPSITVSLPRPRR